MYFEPWYICGDPLSGELIWRRAPQETMSRRFKLDSCIAKYEDPGYLSELCHRASELAVGRCPQRHGLIQISLTKNAWRITTSTVYRFPHPSWDTIGEIDTQLKVLERLDGPANQALIDSLTKQRWEALRAILLTISNDQDSKVSMLAPGATQTVELARFRTEGFQAVESEVRQKFGLPPLRAAKPQKRRKLLRT